MTKKALAAVLALVLFALPFAIRWLAYYEGRYRPGEVARPDLASVSPPAPEMAPFVDEIAEELRRPGIVLVDRAHGNRFQMGELNVLQARLAARGRRLETLESADDLGVKLRYAQALVIISPGTGFAQEEIQRIQTFVDKGGRLLLVADPTRFGILTDEYGEFLGVDSDVTHLNEVAAGFGLLFQPDYLYNTTEHEGNFRNIHLTQIAAHPLTRGLQQVVFYAAHSIRSKEPGLIATSGETRSSVSERVEALPVAVLAAGDSVLALGDLTFMTEPYNAAYDNDRLIANIADFVSGAQRQYDLADFPFFFRDEVSLVYAGEPLLNSDLLRGGSALQALFTGQGKKLTVRPAEDKKQDTLFFGLYEEAEDVQAYLDAAGVTVVLSDTVAPESQTEESGASTDLDGAVTPAPTHTQELTVTAGVSPLQGGWVEVESVGQLVMTGTALLLLQGDADRRVLVVLSGTEEGLSSAVERLNGGDLEGCLIQRTTTPADTTVALCPTGETAEGDGSGGWEETEPEPPETDVEPPAPTPAPAITDTEGVTEPVGIPEGRILVVSLDTGEGRYDSLTGADDFAAVLEDYDVTVWSKAEDGAPSTSELTAYDLVIWTAGDFQEAFGEEERAALGMLMQNGTPIVVSGAYVAEAEREAVQRDIKVQDASHPVMEGFAEGDEIDFLPAPSGSEYQVNVLSGNDSEDALVLFVRGPDSEAPDTPSVLLLEDKEGRTRLLYLGFPIYLLPEEAKTLLVVNAVNWMLSP